MFLKLIVVMVTKLWESTKNWYVHLKWIKCTVCKWYPNRTVNPKKKERIWALNSEYNLTDRFQTSLDLCWQFIWGMWGVGGVEREREKNKSKMGSKILTLTVVCNLLIQVGFLPCKYLLLNSDARGFLRTNSPKLPDSTTLRPGWPWPQTCPLCLPHTH